jgi:hypothetical protein
MAPEMDDQVCDYTVAVHVYSSALMCDEVLVGQPAFSLTVRRLL